jgi:alpha-L-fucosidase
MLKYVYLIILIGFVCCSPDPIAPYGATPTKAQLDWHAMEYYMFIHFGPNTFTNKEWGHGDEDPEVFNPTALDCRQWAATAKQAGMKGIIITAKHHDGFCLWPSQFSTHTVRESKWMNGEGDVLKLLSEACREFGLKFGVYLSPWDRNHPDYGTAEYNLVFVNMLEEVLGNYGEVFEQWFDGANGEGPNGKRQEYDWPLFNSTVYRLQPQAVIFSDGGPGCRWVGNEKGFAGETNWCTLNADSVYPGYPDYHELIEGHEDGTHWVPAECDVSIRPGWFYSPDTDNEVKTLEQLREIYFASVGRGANLLLNVPVDRRGLIPAEDSTRLMELRTEIDKTFRYKIKAPSRIRTSSSLRNFPSGNLTDEDPRSVWAASSNESWIELEYVEPIRFNMLVLKEGIVYGQRVKSFAVEVWKDGGYHEIEKQSTIGYKRILEFDEAIETNKVRIKILESKAPLVLADISLYQS